MTRTDEASLQIAAPAARVFDALLDPDALARWLPPDGMVGRVDELDPTPGGALRLTLTYAEPPASGGKSTADSDIVDATFIEIEPDVRVVLGVVFDSDDPAFAGMMRMSWEVAAHSGGTMAVFRAEGVPDGIRAEDHIAGLTQSLRNLAALVTE